MPKKITTRESAYLNLNTAKYDIDSAENYWCQGSMWNHDCIRSIGEAIGQLTSAMGKMYEVNAKETAARLKDRKELIYGKPKRKTKTRQTTRS